ncbi:MAG: flagellar motor stator protein MotA [Melioribacteraceae bacterium]|jgi:chemotaxis protein MotA|nr:flagellar motor stator protein MotA [Ignavibacteriota bacterium]MBZ0182613.1 flagellar motor stator protein MotA [Melioribacteraceae bacterium]
MFIIIGAIVVTVGVIVGFLMAGGNLIVLLQISEFVTIGGAAIGSLLISAPLETIKQIIAAIPKAIKGNHVSKKDYMDLLKSFYELFLVAQRDGLLAIEKHIENPKESDVLSRNEKFIKNEVALTFLCDTLKVMLSGGVPPHEVESLMDTEIETYEMEQKPIPHLIAKTGDALPGLGIVAAVLGIIVTMGSINDGAEAVGKHVAAALVGTFLGVLLSYGFVNPLATNIEHQIEGNVRYLETIKAAVVAYAKGNPPIVAVEIARRTIYSDARPTFSELENFLRGKE